MRFLFGNHVLDIDQRQLRLGAESVPLEPLVFDLLVYLVVNRERVVSKDDVLDAVWSGRIVSESALTTRIAAARRVIGDSGEAQNLIRTIPRKGLRFVGQVREEGAAMGQGDPLLIRVTGMTPKPETALLAPADKPSIAVLPFENMSSDPEQEYFSDGMADDIITELSRTRSLFVIARNSSFTFKGRAVDVKQIAHDLDVRYVLEGSVRHDSGQVRVNAQLIDAETGNNIWAERYDRAVEGVFAVQDEITAAVVRAIHPAVADAEQRRTLRKLPENLDAWEAYQRGLWHISRHGSAECESAKGFFRRAIELDPTLSAAYVSLAIGLFYSVTMYGTVPLDEAMSEAVVLARTAVSIDSNDADAQAILALAIAGSGGSDEAWDRVSKALATHPNSWLANMVAGRFLMWRGQPARGRVLLGHALRINPRDPVNPFFECVIITCHYFERDYNACLEIARRTIAEQPGFPHPYKWVAAALGQLGRVDEAREALREAMAVSRGAIEFYTRARAPHIRVEDHNHILDGLRKAGWEG